jgi:non-specific protein-tyrosine kinase
MTNKLRFYLHVGLRYVFFVLVPAVTIAALAYEYSNHKPRVYAASTTLYVQQPAPNQSVGSVDVSGSSLLAPTYSDMITDPVITSQVDSLISKSYPGYRIESHSLTTDQKPGSLTLLVRLTVQDVLPRRAALAANTVAEVFIKRLKYLDNLRFAHDDAVLRRELSAAQAQQASAAAQLRNFQSSDSGYQAAQGTYNADQATVQQLQLSYTQFQVNRDNVLTGVNVYSPAVAPHVPVSPHPARDGLLALAVTCLLAAAAVRGYDYMDDSLRDPQEVEEITGAPILGAVPRFNHRRGESPLVTVSKPTSPSADAYRLIRTNLSFSTIDNPVHTLLVTSTQAGEGKSTTASNLAQVFAEGDYRVNLIDADLRSPTLHRLFGIPRNSGLTNMLLVAGPSAVRHTSLDQRANPNVIPSGPLPPNPADLLGSKRMRSLLDELNREGGITIVDCPPILAVPDPVVLATMVDGVVLVVDLDRTKRRDLRRASEAAKAVGGRVVGTVINRLAARGVGYYYYDYGYRDAYSRDDEGKTA